MGNLHAPRTTNATENRHEASPASATWLRRIIFNNHATDPVYIGTDTVTASGATQGLKIPAGTSREIIDCQDAIHIIADATKTPSYTILEISNGGF
jgi:hypothetical protein